MSCLRALSRQVAGAGGRWKQGAGAGCRCRALVRAVVLNELAARAFKRVSVLVLVLWSWVLVL